jgi:hypothetical protein
MAAEPAAAAMATHAVWKPGARVAAVPAIPEWFRKLRLRRLRAWLGIGVGRLHAWLRFRWLRVRWLRVRWLRVRWLRVRRIAHTVVAGRLGRVAAA